MTTLIGIPDEETKALLELSPEISKIGGKQVNFQSCAPVAANCRTCQQTLVLVTQIYCPLHNSPYHRILYVFACVHPKCRNTAESWYVYRVQKLDSSYSSNTHEVISELLFESDSWCNDEDDWGTGESPPRVGDCYHGDTTYNETTTHEPVVETCAQIVSGKQQCEVHDSIPKDVAGELQQLTLSSSPNGPVDCTPEDIPVGDLAIMQHLNTSAQPDVCSGHDLLDVSFVGYYLSVFEEPDDTMDDMLHEKRLLSAYVKKENVDFEAMFDLEVSGRSASSEKYEKALPRHGDVAFQKFSKVLRRCPEQCVRYHWDGSPLNLVNSDTPVPCCQSCGSERVYELQLMPALVSALKVKDRPDETILEFGTVLVYSCRQSCWHDDDHFRTEYVKVQCDPDQHLFK